MESNYQKAVNGSIWVMWDPNWFEHVNERQGDLNCFVTVVYGYNEIEHRQSSWQELQHIAIGISIPWLIIGDFNAMLTLQDRPLGIRLLMLKLELIMSALQGFF
ncbi:hypothetical protein P3S68_019954 [Capsicum galapagoense]